MQVEIENHKEKDKRFSKGIFKEITLFQSRRCWEKTCYNTIYLHILGLSYLPEKTGRIMACEMDDDALTPEPILSILE